MFPDFLPPQVLNLREDTSITLAQNIQKTQLPTPLSPHPIPTTYVKTPATTNPDVSPFLLLHGFDSSLLEYRRLFPQLAPNAPTWLIDLLGFGFTERFPDIPFSPESIKTHLYAFWETCIQHPMILVGASMGGATALDFTLTYPQAVEKLILLDSAGLAQKPIMSKFLFPPLGFFATEFLRNPRVRENISRAAYFDKNFVTPDANLCASLHIQLPHWNKALIAFTKSGGYGGFLNKLQQIKPDTLIIWGANDQILGTKAAYQFQKSLPNNQLVWIEECGHVPHLEKPKTTAEVMLNWVMGNGHCC
ncbi:alpha/beta hydrolase [Spirulina sp. CS-785/01]|uniref:alpha/beta fold hydrolase n=1 Tax=Spirulina sp. CS-785/01 TaxID=3021716 RepID=UPI00232EB21A|nr:alpha/beta hydrolase [Spirulina sp. CS-785/01]MDB9312607.1 alpha/beta hydrolase [Spirulina sp. CS-785/01]